MRLIDADELKGMFEKFYSDRKDIVEMLLSDVDFQPTVDPVKRGYWIHIYELPRGDYFKCSECNHQIFLKFGWKVSSESPADEYRYCSGCGARMDGEENDSIGV